MALTQAQQTNLNELKSQVEAFKQRTLYDSPTMASLYGSFLFDTIEAFNGKIREIESDTTPPEIVTNVEATSPSIGQAVVEWDVTFPTDTIEFEVFSKLSTGTEFTSQGIVTTNRFSQSGLTSASSYDFKIVAIDGAGNRSGDSAVATVTIA